MGEAYGVVFDQRVVVGLRGVDDSVVHVDASERKLVWNRKEIRKARRTCRESQSWAEPQLSRS